MKQYLLSAPALFHNSEFQSGQNLELSYEESQHAKALRLKIGDALIVLNGAGLTGTARVIDIAKKGIYKIEVQNVSLVLYSGKELTLVMAMLESKPRFEWCIEKATELGVQNFIPLKTNRTIGRFDPERAERVALSAIKQCKRFFLPKIFPTLKLEEFALNKDIQSSYDIILLCYETQNTDETIIKAISNFTESTNKIAVIIGPEGGFEPKEIELLQNITNLRIVSLGSNILRAETAAITALAAVSLY